MHQHHLAHSCNLPLFLLTEGIKKLTQTAVQMPLFFYAAKGKKSLNSCVNGTHPGGIPKAKFLQNL